MVIKNVTNKSVILRDAIDQYLDEVKTEMGILDELQKITQSTERKTNVSTVNLTVNQIELIHKIIEKKYFFSRSELIREAVKHYIVSEYKKLKDPNSTIKTLNDKLGSDVVLPDGNGNHIKYVVKEVLK